MGRKGKHSTKRPVPNSEAPPKLHIATKDKPTSRSEPPVEQNSIPEEHEAKEERTAERTTDCGPSDMIPDQ